MASMKVTVDAKEWEWCAGIATCGGNDVMSTYRLEILVGRVGAVSQFGAVMTVVLLDAQLLLQGEEC